MAMISTRASLPCVDLSSAIASCCPLSSPVVLVRSNQRRAVARALHIEERRTGSETVRVRAAGNWNLGSLRGGGAGLLERPSFDQSQFDPLLQVQEGGDIGKLKGEKGLGSGDSFRVLLIDDARHTVALGAAPSGSSVTPDEARKLFYESRQQGVTVVLVTVKEHAEFYAQMMVRNGMRSAIEPDSA
ncbi:unnamed protein product [Spirodela intermedia]|uniref:Uncharacterized protein n=1 Tax=Spirodela intermedia TaxID=51605 RepID=A0A7I8JUK2_SPIIN|nr:unnamed protein product [Spirodela intermedia]CAA6673411.1 unnamed protein product [Spirodela intermedia]